MSKDDNILKINEVRKLIKAYNRPELESVVETLYKMLIKAQKLDNNVTELSRILTKSWWRSKLKRENSLDLSLK